MAETYHGLKLYIGGEEVDVADLTYNAKPAPVAEVESVDLMVWNGKDQPSELERVVGLHEKYSHLFRCLTYPGRKARRAAKKLRKLGLLTDQ